MVAKSKTSEKSRKSKISVHRGRIYVNASYNNTILTFTDDKGDVMAWSSAGIVGFKGARKSTPYAGQKAAEDLNNKISKLNVEGVDVYIRGVGASKMSVLKELSNGGYRILSLIDNNPVRMGGTRPRKAPRK